MLAAMHGKTDCVRRLLDAGANVSLTDIVLVIATCTCWSWRRIAEWGVPFPCGCVQIVMFDSSHGRTCLHYAAYYGHADCLRTILSAAKSAPVSESWLAFVAPDRLALWWCALLLICAQLCCGDAGGSRGS